MAHYLVKARPQSIDILRERLDSGEIQALRPFGGEMDQALRRARITPDGWAVWEEQCFCSPPLKQERLVLDRHFTDLTTETIQADEGWSQINDLPPLWDE
jgi:hypothetical protein